ncbi:MAG: hypothetical protein NTZ73_03075 [Candidatus Diapherotrites archaeon]|nr:hypothetical protein [Candidatus Diapherotrites archaeon]
MNPKRRPIFGKPRKAKTSINLVGKIIPIVRRRKYRLLENSFSMRDALIVRDAMKYLLKIGARVPTISDIGLFKNQPKTIHEVVKMNTLPKVMSYDLIRSVAPQASKKCFRAVDLFAHFGVHSHLGLFREMGYPEFTLQYLEGEGYLEHRRKDFVIPAEERLLKDALASAEKKYGRKKIGEFKKRFEIVEFYDQISTGRS